MKNLPCHIELVSVNIEETASFYQELFGWEVIEAYISGYRLIKFQPDFPIGGAILEVKEKIATEKHWPLVYIEVDSINETLELALNLAATLMIPKTEIPGRGFWAVFADQDGNQIALLEKLVK